MIEQLWVGEAPARRRQLRRRAARPIIGALTAEQRVPPRRATAPRRPGAARDGAATGVGRRAQCAAWHVHVAAHRQLNIKTVGALLNYDPKYQ